MRNDDEDNQLRTVFCGNLSEDVTDKILYELFIQAGPVESVRRPKDPNGRPKSFAFIVFKHECSVPYAVHLFRYTKLFNRTINVNTRNTHLEHIPVLDTHLTEFTGCQENRNESRRSQHSEIDSRNKRNQSGHGNSRHRRSREDNEQDKVSSWTEFKNDPLRANRLLQNSLDRGSLQPSLSQSREHFTNPVMHDLNALLLMGQQMINPGVMGLPNMMPFMGLGPGLGNNVFPSMQGMMSGGDRYSPPRERRRTGYESRERKDFPEERGSRRVRESQRDHPYDDRRHNRWQDHKHHDRGYSSSRSSHERERRSR